MNTILVTGATGAVGPTLVTHLLANGYKVRTYSRSVSQQLPEEVDQRQGDLLDRRALSAALEGVSIVFHLAAMLHIENPSSELAEEYERVNVLGTRALAENAVTARVKRIVYFSTVKVYGIHQYPPLSEDDPTAPTTVYARTKLQGEYEVTKVKDIETVILRLSAVYGPRLRGAWARLIKAVRRRWFLPVGDLNNRRSLTYVEDVARAALLVAQHPQSAGHIYNVVGHPSPMQREIMIAIYSACGQRLPRLHIPGGLAHLGAGLLEMTCTAFGKCSPITPEMINQFIEDETYSGEALSSLGFIPSVSLEEGWQLTLELMT